MPEPKQTIGRVVVPPRRLGDLVAPLRATGLLAGDLMGEDAENKTILDIVEDSRLASDGVLFGAIEGDFFDGHDFVEAAARKGAVAAVVNSAWAEVHAHRAPKGEEERLRGVALVPVTDTRAALAEVAAAFFDRPADHLTLIGVTGTNGKTTTTFLLHHLLTSLGEKTGLVSTVENRIGVERYATSYTTPEPVSLQRLLRAMVDAGVSHTAMEVSSHGLALQRVRTLNYRTAVFTNLTQDHLDFHGTFEAYTAAKKSFFDGLSIESTAVVNRDDTAWETMVSDTAARVVTYGLSSTADVRVEVLENSVAGLRLRLDGQNRSFRLAGRFNALNLAAAYTVGRDLGYDAAEVLDSLESAAGVSGRFEAIRSGDGILGIVDYAHTPDALENVLRAAREIVPEENRLIVVFGCGGDRDRSKRPLMAEAASLADQIFVTSDNPRTEDPKAIIDEILDGFSKMDNVTVIEDRAEAIRASATASTSGDVLVVAGKGHETYQIIGREKRPFDDREVLGSAFQERNRREGAAA